MSDSELSEPTNVPTAAAIEASLTRAVRDIQKSGGDVTINNARRLAEEALDLGEGFLKQTEWKGKSKEIITTAVHEGEEPESRKKVTKPAPGVKAKPAAKAGRKRKSDDDDDEAAAEPQRRRKTKKVESEDKASEPQPESEPEDDKSAFEEAEEEVKPKKKAIKRAAKKPALKRSKKAVERGDSEHEEGVPDVKTNNRKSADKVESEDEENEPVEEIKTAKEDTSELSDVPDKISEHMPQSNVKPAAPEDDDSDMSVVLDEPPKKKRQKKTETASKAKSTAKETKVKATKAKPAKKELSADEEEVKRLQGWLVKCGIRKLWHRELANCSNDKAKINHLKGMLDDAGMSGRYSNEKAQKIKDQRELAAELEAVKEYEENWGQSEGEDDDKDDDEDEKTGESKGDEQPKRRLPKGLIDFGDSGDDGSD